MCLFFVILLFSPRAAAILWWIVQPMRWDAAFTSFLWPMLGIVFAPWTTMMYIIVSPRGVEGWDWLWVALMAFADIVSWTSAGYKNRDKIGM